MTVSSQDDNETAANIQWPLTPLDAPPTKSRVCLDLLVVSPVADRRGSLYVVAGTFRIWSILQRSGRVSLGSRRNQVKFVVQVNFNIQANKLHNIPVN
jgi:hypothetical protein